MQLSAQEGEFSQNQEVGFIIIHATKNYEVSKRVAQEASKHLGYKLDLAGLEYNEDIGLSISEEDCEQAGFEYPAYIQRGRLGDNKFISVEYTDIYPNFTPGYYIVVVANYIKGDEKINETLKFVKKHYTNAYIKYTDIYMGCLH